MGIQAKRWDISFLNSIFAVHIANFIPLYAFERSRWSQYMTPCDCLDKVSVQFLPTDANRKGGTLDKSLFMLDLGQTTVQFHTPTAAFYSYLVLQVSLIGCHGTTSV